MTEKQQLLQHAIMSELEPVDSNQTRKILLAALCEFLTVFREASEAPSDPIRIVVHQYGFTPLYAPVYMAFTDLLEASQASRKASNGSDDFLSIEYRSAGSDDAAERTVTNKGSWQPGSPAELHLGLSEVVSRSPISGEADLLVEQPVIKRLPLWGVALQNNPKINRLKRERRSYEDNELLDFWTLFAGKLSLLQPSDFKGGSEDSALTVSIYRKGTTVFRLFAKYLNESNEDLDLDRLTYVDFKTEFDSLFHSDEGKKIDVALTVQPWRALSKAQVECLTLEVVYAHAGKPEPVTSLYIAKEAISVDVWRAFLDILGDLVQTNVEDLYGGLKTALGRAYQCYTGAIAASSTGNGENIDTKENAEEFRYAMHLLSDSRVYYYDIRTGRSALPHVRAQKRLLTLRQEIACYFDVVGRRNLPYTCSILAAKVSNVANVDWHWPRKMSFYTARNGMTEVIHGFKKMVLQTSLWVSSTLSRMLCKEDVRWTAWSCTGKCLG